MSMPFWGLLKLTEECGELVQVASKLASYPRLVFAMFAKHPDGTVLRERLQDEMGDVLAAIQFVTEKLTLDSDTIDARKFRKLSRFRQWDTEPDVAVMPVEGGDSDDPECGI